MLKIGHLEAKNSENEAKIDNLEKRDFIIINHLEAANAESEAKIGYIKAKNVAQDKEINELKTRLNIELVKPISPEFFGELPTKTTEPSTCKELATNGHSFSGLYLVKNLGTKKLEAVSCSFGTTGKFKTNLAI